MLSPVLYDTSWAGAQWAPLRFTSYYLVGAMPSSPVPITVMIAKKPPPFLSFFRQKRRLCYSCSLLPLACSLIYCPLTYRTSLGMMSPSWSRAARMI